MVKKSKSTKNAVKNPQKKINGKKLISKDVKLKAPKPASEHKSKAVSKKQKQEEVDNMLERLSVVKENQTKRRNIRPLSATVTLVSLIGILVSLYLVVPRSLPWGYALVVFFVVVLIASIYSLSYDWID